MPLNPLTLTTLGDLDNGAARAVIDKAISLALEDLDDRGEDEKERVVGIQLKMRRMSNGQFAAHVEAGVTLPKFRTHDTYGKSAGRHGQTQFLFNSMAPDDPDQRTIDEVEDRSGK